MKTHAAKHALMRFARDEDGAVTVDWVLGTAMAIALTLSVLGSVREATVTLADSMSNTIQTMPLPDYGTGNS